MTLGRATGKMVQAWIDGPGLSAVERKNILNVIPATCQKLDKNGDIRLMPTLKAIRLHVIMHYEGGHDDKNRS